MDVLTRERAKPALRFGGVHRLVDFAMSCLVHSDINEVWVSVEYQVSSIDDHLSGGRPWSLDRNRGGFRRMVPQTGTGSPTEEGFAHGNADLLLRMSGDIEMHAKPVTVVLSADSVFNIDLGPIIEEHVREKRVATLLTTEVTKREATDNVVVLAGRGGKVTGVEVKPAKPSSNTVATEIFIYDTAALLQALRELRQELDDDLDPQDAEDGDSGLGDFGEHLLPQLIESGKVVAVPLPGYWRDAGQPATYLQAHRDLLAGKVDVFDHPERPIISRWQDRPAARIQDGAVVADALLGQGSVVAGEVRRSVLGPGVVVEAGAVVEDCVLMEATVVRSGARVHTSIIDERCEIAGSARIGATPTARVAKDEDLVLVGVDCTVSGTLEPGARLEPGSSA